LIYRLKKEINIAMNPDFDEANNIAIGCWKSVDESLLLKGFTFLIYAT
jgi:hypothetical protein